MIRIMPFPESEALSFFQLSKGMDGKETGNRRFYSMTGEIYYNKDGYYDD